MTAIEDVTSVGEPEQGWGDWVWARSRAGVADHNLRQQARAELDDPVIDLDPKQVVCRRCFLAYWAPLGACPECPE